MKTYYFQNPLTSKVIAVIASSLKNAYKTGGVGSSVYCGEER